MHKTQVVIVRGGTTFSTQEDYLRSLSTNEVTLERLKPRVDWKTNLQSELGSSFEVLLPQMPNTANAQYKEWEMYFRKLDPLLKEPVILIGHSLGGAFLAKYLSENNFSKNIRAVILVAAPFNEEILASFFVKDSPIKLQERSKNIIIYHSKDDMVVPYTEAEKYMYSLPQATLHSFEDKGHFNDEYFPELARNIKELAG